MSLALALGLHVNEIAGQGAARGLCGVADIISNCATQVRFNKEAAAALAIRICDFVSILTTEQNSRDDELPEWNAAVDEFKHVLDDVAQNLQEIGRPSYLAQALRRDRDADAIRGMAQRVQHSMSVFTLSASVEIQTELQGLIKSLEPATPSATVPTSVPAQRLPSPAAYYFGRAAETERAVTALDATSPAYIAVLGGPGMGKTSLSLAVLHHPALISRFGTMRFFVACDASDNRLSLLSVLCSAFSIASTSVNTRQRALVSLLRGPALLVLDNFESAWEGADQRHEAEDTLAFLGGIDRLSIVITLRGSERPRSLAWTTPLLPALSSLDVTFSSQLFVSISDIGEDDPFLPALLACTDHVPLAVVLLANLAQYEGGRTLLVRWEEQKTAVLQRGDGSHRLSSMDVSLSLSLSSPRVLNHPSAVQLLGLLSVLPQGALRADIEPWFPPSVVGKAISVLLQNSLAHWSTERLYVLAPIREFMLSMHYPQPPELSALFSHYWSLIGLIRPPGRGSSSPEAVACILPELTNIYSVVSHGLNHPAYQNDAAAAAVNLAYLLYDTGYGSFDIVQKALAVSRERNLVDVTASLLYQWGLLANLSAAGGEAARLWKEARALYQSSGNLGGIIDTSTRLASFEVPEKAVELCLELYNVAVEAGEWRKAIVALQRLSHAHYGMGNYALSLKYEQEAVDMLYAHQPGELRLLGYSLSSLGNILCSQGQFASGMAKLRDAVPILSAAHSYDSLGEAEYTLANFSLLAEKNAEALVHLQEGQIASRKAHNAFSQIRCFHLSAISHSALGDFHSTAETINSMELLIRDSGQTLGPCARAQSLHAKAMLSTTNDWEEAAAMLQEAVVLSHRPDPISYPDFCAQIGGMILRSLGSLNFTRGDLPNAKICFITSAAVLRSHEQPQLLHSLTRLAEVLPDDATNHLLAALMPVLLHSSLNGLLASAFLTSADVTFRQGDIRLAHHRVQSAQKYLAEVDTVQLHARAGALCEKCSIPLSEQD
ncbi:hypothetical protein EXIGLDRAFT_831258 [Exidia glandulosa HHB12029]|uniref:Novel STAND NTPase 1 domain-containing protein n=1 Tax=Exidia glandulosa HHB12029 TaxID=1314781 RepID=A0A165MSZ0_EXIGL|nr:hypothetical protein EXIGLDRAFT_831258 [Exidia glandulosa HHB12029]